MRPGLTRPSRSYCPRDVALLREVQRLSQEDGVNLAGIKRIIDLESQVEALQQRVQELITEVELAEHRAMAAESAVRAGFGRDGDSGAIVPLRPATSALVVWRPRDER